ncbi:MAG: tRNA guanosine(34) transglycosylase Tgt [bacterium]|nr:tRNA guanosine(34) transglycosylase Tgt [bacterium]
MEQCFSIRTKSASCAARAGELQTGHGVVQTPCFMPIGTVGAVKHVTPAELRAAGAQIVLSNTYHLMLRPGTDYLAARGGLHAFMRWDGPILTDSGGYQAFSLGARTAARGNAALARFTDDGVRFRSHVDGSAQELTPESVVDHQRKIGSDIAMVLDVCPPQPCTRDVLEAAVEQTTRWAARAKAHASRVPNPRAQKLFGIVQGGSDEVLRRRSAEDLVALDFDGYAIGGVAVGEEQSKIREAIAMTAPLLPTDKPRYLMGLGTPSDIVHAVRCGVDMFDCVLPTRDARHGRTYAWVDRSAHLLDARTSMDDAWYTRFAIGRAEFRASDEPIDAACPCPTCRTFDRAYLRHLFAIGEPLGARLLTLHNLTFYFELMRRLRECVELLGSDDGR